MGGYFGVVSNRNIVEDVFFGTDYHSHLGSYRAGIVIHNEKAGFLRKIHNIETDPFRSKFLDILDTMSGNSGLGCISDAGPSPLIIASRLGVYAICLVGSINNKDALVDELLENPAFHFDALNGGRINEVEVVASLINQKDSFKEGILYAHSKIEGSCNLLILTNDGTLIASRDKLGRIPLLVGKNEHGYAFSFESFAFYKTGYEMIKELGPTEIVEARWDSLKVLSEPTKPMKICAFLWNYFGYATSSYEGRNVEMMRNANGKIMAQHEKDQELFNSLDYVCGVPDSGLAHALGYAKQSNVEYARCFIKYTPSWSRSFLPDNHDTRKHIAKMKQIPVKELIENKNLLFVDDSIVRGTQFKETVDFLKENGANEVHMRSACPPMMYPCKYLNFSRTTDAMELITRVIISELEGEEGFSHIDDYIDGETERGKNLRDEMAKRFNFASMDFQTVEGIIEAIGIDPECLCTYCWNGEG